MADLRSLLEQLSNCIGVAGRERAVRTLIRQAVEPHVDRVEVDALGNLIAYKAGEGPEPRLRLMLAAHMDEVGLMVTRVEKSGLLKFKAVGGLQARSLLAKRVLIGDDAVPGIIGTPPPHLQTPEQRRKWLDFDDLSIDIGADNGREGERKVKVGDYGAFATRFAELTADPAWPAVRGKAFDDRAGCAVLVSLLEERYPVDIIAAFTVQEEVGLRGAGVAAYRTKPDAAIVLEGTVCNDLPQPSDQDRTPVTRLGAGPALTLLDRSMVAHPGMLRLLQDAATSAGIPYQFKAPGIGGTDGGAIHLAREGVPAAVVAVPCRYIHGPASILNLNDLQNMARLVAAAAQTIGRAHLERA